MLHDVDVEKVKKSFIETKINKRKVKPNVVLVFRLIYVYNYTHKSCIVVFTIFDILHICL